MSTGLRFVRHGSLQNHSSAGVGSSLFEVYTASEGQTLFPLIGKYRVGLNELQVHINGIKQTIGLDYEETSEQSITLLAATEAGDKIVFAVNEIRNTSLHEEYIATEGQTVFLLSASYKVGQYSLMVYEDGILLRKGDDYQEIDEKTVQFLYPISSGSKITFHEIV